MAFTAFYDASGREESSRFVAVAGVVASEAAWLEFESEWRGVLDAEGIKEFHHADFKASQDEFRYWRGDEQRRAHFLSALMDILEKHVVQWASSGMHPRGFTRLSKEFDVTRLGGAYMVGAAWAKTVVEQWRDAAHPGEPILHTFEKGDSGQKPTCRLEDLGSDVIALDKYTKERGYIYAFQAADLIAGELTTLLAGSEADDKHRIGRKPLQRIFQMPGEVVNADYFLLANTCRKFPHLFPQRITE